MAPERKAEAGQKQYLLLIAFSVSLSFIRLVGVSAESLSLPRLKVTSSPVSQIFNL